MPKPTDAAIRKAAPKILERLRTGQSTVQQERETLGLKSHGPLTRVLVELAGGKEEYQAALAEGRRAKRPPKPTRDPAVPRARREPPPRPSDEGVPVIHSCKKRDGWTTGTTIIRHRRVDLFTDPDGHTYTPALDTERADLIYDAQIPGLDPLRLRLFETSSKAKRQRKERKLLKRASDAKRTRSREEAA